MDVKYLKKIVKETWKNAVFLALIWLVIQFFLELLILSSVIFDGKKIDQFSLFAQFFLLLLSIMFPIIVGYLAANNFPYNKVKKATRLGVGLISGTIFGVTIGFFTIVFSTIVFVFASVLVGFFATQTDPGLTVDVLLNIFGVLIVSSTLFVIAPLTIIFGAIYGSIGGLLKKLY